VRVIALGRNGTDVISTMAANLKTKIAVA